MTFNLELVLLKQQHRLLVAWYSRRVQSQSATATRRHTVASRDWGNTSPLTFQLCNSLIYSAWQVQNSIASRRLWRILCLSFVTLTFHLLPRNGMAGYCCHGDPEGARVRRTDWVHYSTVTSAFFVKQCFPVRIFWFLIGGLSTVRHYVSS